MCVCDFICAHMFGICLSCSCTHASGTRGLNRVTELPSLQSVEVNLNLCAIVHLHDMAFLKASACGKHKKSASD